MQKVKLQKVDHETPSFPSRSLHRQLQPPRLCPFVDKLYICTTEVNMLFTLHAGAHTIGNMLLLYIINMHYLFLHIVLWLTYFLLAIKIEAEK